MSRGALSPAAPAELPIHLTPFIGRDRELDDLARLVGEARLAAPAGAGEGEQACLADQAREVVELAIAADERREVHREPGGRGRRLGVGHRRVQGGVVRATTGTRSRVPADRSSSRAATAACASSAGGRTSARPRPSAHAARPTAGRRGRTGD
jgi:hypothetical protein